MRTGKHTLGPFRVETPASSSGFGKAIYATREDAPDVFVAYVGNWKQHPATENADAALFASSLDMLAALEKAREFIKEEADNRGDAGSEYSDYEREPRELVKEIDAVIRAARGRANG